MKVTVGSTNKDKGIVRISAVRDAGAFAAAVEDLEEEYGITVEQLVTRDAGSEWSSQGERFTFKRRKSTSRASAGLYLTDIEAF